MEDRELGRTPVSNDNAQEQMADRYRRCSGNHEHRDAYDDVFKKAHLN
jgi:hypothetical protein